MRKMPGASGCTWISSHTAGISIETCAGFGLLTLHLADSCDSIGVLGLERRNLFSGSNRRRADDALLQLRACKGCLLTHHRVVGAFT